MIIENNTLYITRIDLDHILDIDPYKENRDTVPSDLFLQGLESELWLAGLEEEGFADIVIKDIGNERKAR